MAIFRSLTDKNGLVISGNLRPTQPLNNRTVVVSQAKLHSGASGCSTTNFELLLEDKFDKSAAKRKTV